MTEPEPQFLSLEQVNELHLEAITEFGGSHGVRDPGLVESALGAARNEFHYGGGDLFAIAAAYAFHLAESQAYLDGNKRTAVAAALTFLDMNVECRRPPQSEFHQHMLAVADKSLSKAGLATKFRALAVFK
jgi:death-on-curing protein